ncbi:hypothetical protein D3C84_981130 [compost metagenome]
MRKKLIALITSTTDSSGMMNVRQPGFAGESFHTARNGLDNMRTPPISSVK